MAVIEKLSSGDGFLLTGEKTTFTRHLSAPDDRHSGRTEVSGSFVNQDGESVSVSFTVDRGSEISRVLSVDDGEYTLTLERS